MRIKKHRNKWKANTYLRICDRSGFVFRRCDMRKEPFTGFIVGKEYYIEENPLTYQKQIVREKQIRID